MARVVFLFLAKKTFRPYVIFLFSFLIQNHVTFLAATKNEYKNRPSLDHTSKVSYVTYAFLFLLERSLRD